MSETHFVLNVPNMTALGGRKQLNLEECIADFMKAEKMTGGERLRLTLALALALKNIR